MFNKGDYIVYLNTTTGAKSYVINNIYKQRENYEYLRSELDSGDSEMNGTDRCSYRDGNHWRYATYYEIYYYNLYNKPYDVNNLEDPIAIMFDNLNKLERKYEKI